jgi:hypothetical protein
MKTVTQLEALRFWFQDHETITLAQAKYGLDDPSGATNVRVKVERVAPLIHELRNEGWTIATGKDETGTAYYRVIDKPGALSPGSPGRVPKVGETKPVVKADNQWQCSKQGCLSGVVPDNKTTFDSRYTTGKCFTHGKVVLVRR